MMYATEGVGLSAPQVGVNVRLMVFNEEGVRSLYFPLLSRTYLVKMFAACDSIRFTHIAPPLL